MTRTEHWATQEFNQFLLTKARAPFVWGENDCCLFVANAIRSFTDVDLAEAFRGKYATETEAFALIKSVTGGDTVADAAAWCASQHGLVEYEFPLMAKRGDLVVVQEEGQTPIAGIVHLNGRHVAVVGQDGLKRLSIGLVKRSWAV